MTATEHIHLLMTRKAESVAGSNYQDHWRCHWTDQTRVGLRYIPRKLLLLSTGQQTPGGEG
jgi:hypothetical protein